MDGEKCDIPAQPYFMLPFGIWGVCALLMGQIIFSEKETGG
jgi:hypothetical protein